MDPEFAKYLKSHFDLIAKGKGKGKGKGRDTWNCTYCQKQMSCTATRLLSHLVVIAGGYSKICEKVQKPAQRTIAEKALRKTKGKSAGGAIANKIAVVGGTSAPGTASGSRTIPVI